VSFANIPAPQKVASTAQALSGAAPSPDDDFPSDDGPQTLRNPANLDWSFTPKIDIQRDGNARCFITQRPTSKLPQKAFRGKGIGLHLVREFQLEPALLERRERLDKDHQVSHGSRQFQTQPLEIRVSEEEFRKYGGNLQELRQNCLPPVKSDLASADDKRQHVWKGRRYMDDIPEAALERMKGKTARPSKLTMNDLTHRNLSGREDSMQQSSSLPNLPTLRSTRKVDDPDAWRPVKMREKKRRSMMRPWSLTKAMTSLRH
jgi:hypothetical protein